MEQNLDSRPAKLYVDGGALARAWKLPRAVVVADVQRGMAGALDALIGAVAGEVCVVETWDITGDRGEAHRKRLTAVQS